MSDAEKRAPQPEAATDAATPSETDASSDAAADAGGWEGGPDYEAVIGALQQELEQARDQRVRAVAEMENLRRRTEREIADARKYAVAGFARDLLSVSDNLTRALTAVGEAERAAAEEVWKNLLEGVEMTERELLAALQKNGVTQINPQGERFDPNQHQAMFDVPDPEQPNGTVVQVVAPGFLIGDRVLRPAMVGVSKGGPKVAPKSAADGPADAAEPGATMDRSA